MEAQRMEILQDPATIASEALALANTPNLEKGWTSKGMFAGMVVKITIKTLGSCDRMTQINLNDQDPRMGESN